MAFTLEQINALVSAGYDLNEILAVNGPVEHVEKPVKTVENPAPAPAPTPATAPAPVGNDAVLDAINNLTTVIQSGNIRMGGFPTPVTPDDPGQILANIINPPAKTGKK